MKAVRVLSAASVFLVIIAIAGCEKNKEKPLDVAGQKIYELKGKIVSRDIRSNLVRIDHDAIPGFMEAMTMDYTVRGTDVASLPPDGSRIVARLHAANDAYWLTDVKKVP